MGFADFLEECAKTWRAAMAEGLEKQEAEKRDRDPTPGPVEGMFGRRPVDEDGLPVPMSDWEERVESGEIDAGDDEQWD